MEQLASRFAPFGESAEAEWEGALTSVYRGLLVIIGINGDYSAVLMGLWLIIGD